ncbi:MAG: Gfo/Idh/MocA family oxidoreductase [Phycisphaeraceae bacterium]|nr:Gfo/Idh/MocA family oxidoreductase [Phycisphaeraceae bacterium]
MSIVKANAKVRYAMVGAGGRLPMFIEPACTTFRDHCEVVGLCDVNAGRIAYYQKRAREEWGYGDIPAYLAADFDKMIQETRPDIVAVCTVDAYHHQYIIRAMELGCDVVTEKPMTTDDAKCRAIFDAIKKTGRKCRVSFNYRWAPAPTLVYRLLRQGIIGDLIHVDMEYLLNTSHGADYFRRWHREKDKSGGLMVHKSTHHFDLVNWWIDAVPQTVFGFGRLAFYGKENGAKRGEHVNYSRYTGSDTGNDPFALKLDSDEGLRKLYLDCEKYDGYIRDRNVFGEPISIEDTMSVLVKYRTGVVLNYSLNAYLPREGFYCVFNGTKGRLEITEAHASHIITGADNADLAHEMKWESQVVVHPMFGRAYQVEIPKAEGSHGGGDPLIQEQIFSPNPRPEVDGRNAGHEQGASSILIGIAANQSFRTGLPVQIKDLCPQLPDHKHLHEMI